MFSKIDKNQDRKKRHLRVRKKISGTSECPRMNVYRSTNHIYVQFIDDVAGVTICSASTMDKNIKIEGKTKAEAAFEVGKVAAKRAKENQISKVVFDRGGYLYTGRVQKLAEGAREAGLEF